VPEDRPCRAPHDHNYVVEVSVFGHIDPGMEWVLDFSALDQYMKAAIDELDHTNLNDRIENPTAENLAAYFLSYIRHTARDSASRLFSVRVWETPKCWAEISG
jgi:6-pyruvoyltetrahydropterin/6-carboxytetrahydropterin synthase